MKRNNKKNIMFGVISLLLSAILQAIFLCYLQRGWLVLVFACIYAIVFLKYLKDERVVTWLIGRFRKKTLKIVGMIVLFIGIAFLPRPSENHLGISAQFVTYITSYIGWMMGLLLIDVSNEH